MKTIPKRTVQTVGQGRMLTCWMADENNEINLKTFDQNESSRGLENNATFTYLVKKIQHNVTKTPFFFF